MKNVKLLRFTGRSVLLIFLTSAFICSSAQQKQVDKDYTPQSGQDGKDVVWVPTPQALVDKMLDMARVTPNDFVIDLGSGDGRTVITAAKRGARARGIEFNPEMVELSRSHAAREGVTGRAEFIQGDLFEADLSQASVITMFLLTSINLKLRPFILELKPGTRIVSNTFNMGEWVPDETASVTGGECSAWCDALLWIVPAKVEGTWKLNDGELTLNQSFQMVTGSLTKGAKSVPVTEGRLNGDQIVFKSGDDTYSGRITGNSMEGTVTSGLGSGQWSAVREGH
jgi:hypothetical protein